MSMLRRYLTWCQSGRFGVPEIDELVGQIMPVIGAAVGAYGAAVLTGAEEGAADATLALGKRFLAWLLDHAGRRAPLEQAVADLASDGRDPDALAALRLQVRKILTAHPELLPELAGMLPLASPTWAHGARSVAIGGNNTAPITTGDHSPIMHQG
jgi:hypothetical protein